MKQKKTLFNVRLTDSQKAKLAAIAVKEYRTMTGVFLFWLDSYPGIIVDTLPHQGAPDGVDVTRISVCPHPPEAQQVVTHQRPNDGPDEGETRLECTNCGATLS